jgi:hypothetical protein
MCRWRRPRSAQSASMERGPAGQRARGAVGLDHRSGRRNRRRRARGWSLVAGVASRVCCTSAGSGLLTANRCPHKKFGRRSPLERPCNSGSSRWKCLCAVSFGTSPSRSALYREASSNRVSASWRQAIRCCKRQQSPCSARHRRCYIIDLSICSRRSRPVHFLEEGRAVGRPDFLSKPVVRARHLGQDHQGGRRQP